MSADTIINLISCIASVVFGILSIIFGNISIKLKKKNKKMLNANIEIKNQIENKVFGVNIQEIVKSSKQNKIVINQTNQFNLSPQEIPSSLLNLHKEGK